MTDEGFDSGRGPSYWESEVVGAVLLLIRDDLWFSVGVGRVGSVESGWTSCDRLKESISKSRWFWDFMQAVVCRKGYDIGISGIMLSGLNSPRAYQLYSAKRSPQSMIM